MKGIKYILPSIAGRGLGLALLLLLAACSKDMTDETAGTIGNDNATASSLLQVTTRNGATGGGATISYPVQVYVFQDDECRAVQTIGDEGQTLNIALVEGTYSVYAVGGASSTDYTLPAKDEATTTTPLALKEGRSHGDLMTASATVTLTDGGTNTMTLGLQRRTMLLQDVTIKKIPTAATAVSVTIAPLWQSLTVCGGFATASSSTTIALTKQSDNRTWRLPSPVGEGSGVRLLPPSSQPASISVNITVGGVTKTYTYSTTDQLEAGYKISIDGTYTEAVGVSLTGTITGATWLGERTISFTFDESGSSTVVDGSAVDNSGTNTVVDGSAVDNTAAFPAVGDTYEGCYVLAVEEAADGESAEVTLLAPTELTGFYGDGDAAAMQANVDQTLATVTVGGISGWDVPTTAQAALMYDARQSIGNLTAASYLCRANNNGLRAFRPTDDDFSAQSSTIRDNTVLRPVATVTLTKD